MVNFSSKLKIVQENSISKFVTHKHNVTIVSSQAENLSERKRMVDGSSLKNKEILHEVTVRFLIQCGIMLFTN